VIETIKKIHFKDVPQRPVSLRIRDDVPDKAFLDVEDGVLVAGVCLDRQALSDLRDCCDEILAGWFCPPDEENYLCPICEDVMDSATAKTCTESFCQICNDPLKGGVVLTSRFGMVHNDCNEKVKQDPAKPIGIDPVMVAALDASKLGPVEDEIEQLRRTT
jgi:hypothetical protein